MNSKNIVAIKDDKILCTCMKCLKEGEKEDMHIIHIPEMGYGSGFDGFDTLIILCDDCYKESIKNIPDLWSMEEKVRTVLYKKNDHLTQEEREANKTISTSVNEYEVTIDMQNDVIRTEDYEDHYDEYKYENEMFAYIHSLPLQSQELVYNRLDRGIFSHGGHDPQDWIDYYLDELSYEKCKENHWIYRGEFDSYREKFEKCDHVVNVIYKDGSKCSECLINKVVHGKFGGKCQDGRTGCYQCEYFKEKNGEMRTIADDKEQGFEVSNIVDEMSKKERIEAGIRPKEPAERLMIINIYDGKNYEECIVIKREDNKYLVVNREDFRDVLHDRKKSKDISIKWIPKDYYIDYIGTLVDERETVIVDIENNAKLSTI